MAVFIILICIIGFFGGIVWLSVRAIKHQETKTPKIVIAASCTVCIASIGANAPNPLLGIIMFSGIPIMIVAIAFILWAIIKKQPKRKWAIVFCIGFAAFILPAVYNNATTTPEERAAQQEQKQQEKKAAEAARQKELAEIDAKKQQREIEKEKAEKDATAQKVYDDQAKYEAWIEQKAQQAYDKQAEYEAWIGQKNQQAYDDQAEYEAWILKEIERICQNEIQDGDRIVKIEVNEDMSTKNYGSGKLIVLPYFKSQSGFRSTELMKVCKMMKALYSSELPISDVTIFTQDMSGMTIMKSTLSAARAKRIEWKSVRYKEFDKQLEEFWAVPALRK